MYRIEMLPFEEAKKAFDKHLAKMKIKDYPNGPQDIHGITKYHWSRFRRAYPDLQDAPGFERLDNSLFNVYVFTVGVSRVSIPCCCCVQRRVELKPHAQWFMDRFLRRD